MKSVSDSEVREFSDKIIKIYLHILVWLLFVPFIYTQITEVLFLSLACRGSTSFMLST